jgi:hypothetical protein
MLPAMSIPISIHSVSIPEYTAEEKPDYSAVGRKLDPVIETHFPDRKMAIRCISLIDHPGLSLETLVATILELGSDWYDPEREGVNYPASATVHHIFTTECIVVSGKLQSPRYHGDHCPCGSVLGPIVSDFYGGTILERGFPLRLDLLLICDLDHLEMAGTPNDRGLGENSPGGLPDCGYYRFRYPDRKPEALLGIVKILRDAAPECV